MDKYFLVEEYRTGTILKIDRNSFIPAIIIGYGRHSQEEEEKILSSKKWSPLSDIHIIHFNTNKEYNSYVGNMVKKWRVHVEYNRELKTEEHKECPYETFEGD